jgi:hypothetical protein
VVHALSAPAGHAGTSGNQGRHVGSEGRADPGQPVAVQAAAPEFVERSEGRGGVGAAPSQPGGHGDVLGEDQAGTAGPGVGLPEGPGRAQHEVFPARGHLAGPGPDHPERELAGGLRANAVGQGEREDQGDDLVVAVGPAAQHPKDRVDLGRRRLGD